MPPDSLYTIRAIARELGLPESTVRYYRDSFEPWIPARGQGRRRRYPGEALPLFRLVAEGYAQNRSRQEIEGALQEVAGEAPARGPAPPTVWPVVHRALPEAGSPDSYQQLLATILDGERERREVMWQMAREIVRLGEAIERQHLVLKDLARNLDADGRRALPPATGERPAREDGQEGIAGLGDQLEALRQELDRERELVDRLRKSKLEIERRAALAEAALEERGGRP